MQQKQSLVDQSEEENHPTRQIQTARPDSKDSGFFLKRKSRVSDYFSPRKKLSQIHLNLIQLEQKFTHFEQALKSINPNNQKKDDADGNFQLKLYPNQPNRDKSPKQKRLKKLRVQKIESSKSQGKKQKIKIDGKVYECKNIPTSYFQNIELFFQNQSKRKNRALKKKKPRNIPLNQSDIKENTENCQENFGVKDKKGQIYNIRFHQKLQKKNDVKNQQINLLHFHSPSNTNPIEQNQQTSQEHSPHRTRQLKQCKRMMNNHQNRVYRYCLCCSNHQSDSASPSPHKKGHDKIINFNPRSRFAKTAEEGRRKKQICQIQDESLFEQSELNDEIDKSFEFSQENMTSTQPNTSHLYRESIRQDSARTKKNEIGKRDKKFSQQINMDNIKSKIIQWPGIKYKQNKTSSTKKQKILKLSSEGCQPEGFQNVYSDRSNNKFKITIRNQKGPKSPITIPTENGNENKLSTQAAFQCQTKTQKLMKNKNIEKEPFFNNVIYNTGSSQTIAKNKNQTNSAVPHKSPAHRRKLTMEDKESIHKSNYNKEKGQQQPRPMSSLFRKKSQQQQKNRLSLASTLPNRKSIQLKMNEFGSKIQQVQNSYLCDSQVSKNGQKMKGSFQKRRRISDKKSGYLNLNSTTPNKNSNSLNKRETKQVKQNESNLESENINTNKLKTQSAQKKLMRKTSQIKQKNVGKMIGNLDKGEQKVQRVSNQIQSRKMKQKPIRKTNHPQYKINLNKAETPQSKIVFQSFGQEKVEQKTNIIDYPIQNFENNINCQEEDQKQQSFETASYPQIIAEREQQKILHKIVLYPEALTIQDLQLHSEPIQNSNIPTDLQIEAQMVDNKRESIENNQKVNQNTQQKHEQQIKGHKNLIEKANSEKKRRDINSGLKQSKQDNMVKVDNKNKANQRVRDSGKSNNKIWAQNQSKNQGQNNQDEEDKDMTKCESQKQQEIQNKAEQFIEKYEEKTYEVQEALNEDKQKTEQKEETDEKSKIRVVNEWNRTQISNQINQKMSINENVNQINDSNNMEQNQQQKGEGDFQYIQEEGDQNMIQINGHISGIPTNSQMPQKQSTVLTKNKPMSNINQQISINKQQLAAQSSQHSNKIVIKGKNHQQEGQHCQNYQQQHQQEYRDELMTKIVKKNDEVVNENGDEVKNENYYKFQENGNVLSQNLQQSHSKIGNKTTQIQEISNQVKSQKIICQQISQIQQLIFKQSSEIQQQTHHFVQNLPNQKQNTNLANQNAEPKIIYKQQQEILNNQENLDMPHTIIEQKYQSHNNQNEERKVSSEDVNMANENYLHENIDNSATTPLTNSIIPTCASNNDVVQSNSCEQKSKQLQQKYEKYHEQTQKQSQGKDNADGSYDMEFRMADQIGVNSFSPFTNNKLTENHQQNQNKQLEGEHNDNVAQRKWVQQEQQEKFSPQLQQKLFTSNNHENVSFQQISSSSNNQQARLFNQYLTKKGEIKQFCLTNESIRIPSSNTQQKQIQPSVEKKSQKIIIPKQNQTQNNKAISQIDNITYSHNNQILISNYRQNSKTNKQQNIHIIPLKQITNSKLNTKQYEQIVLYDCTIGDNDNSEKNQEQILLQQQQQNTKECGEYKENITPLLTQQQQYKKLTQITSNQSNQNNLQVLIQKQLQQSYEDDNPHHLQDENLLQNMHINEVKHSNHILSAIVNQDHAHYSHKQMENSNQQEITYSERNNPINVPVLNNKIQQMGDKNSSSQIQSSNRIKTQENEQILVQSKAKENQQYGVQNNKKYMVTEQKIKQNEVYNTSLIPKSQKIFSSTTKYAYIERQKQLNQIGVQCLDKINQFQPIEAGNNQLQKQQVKLLTGNSEYKNSFILKSDKQQKWEQKDLLNVNKNQMSNIKVQPTLKNEQQQISKSTAPHELPQKQQNTINVLHINTASTFEQIQSIPNRNISPSQKSFNSGMKKQLQMCSKTVSLIQKARRISNLYSMTIGSFGLENNNKKMRKSEQIRRIPKNKCFEDENKNLQANDQLVYSQQTQECLQNQIENDQVPQKNQKNHMKNQLKEEKQDNQNNEEAKMSQFSLPINKIPIKKQLFAEIVPLIRVQNERTIKKSIFFSPSPLVQYQNVQNNLKIIQEMMALLNFNYSDFINRLFTPKKNGEFWFNKKQFRLYQAKNIAMEANKEEFIKQLYVQLYTHHQKDLKDIRTLLKSLTGCPILHLEKNKWSKIKNIKKHGNVFGFALEQDGSIHRIIGTEQVKQNESTIKLVKLKKSNGKCVNIRWEKLLKNYQYPFLIALNPKYFIRSVQIPYYGAKEEQEQYLIDLDCKKAAEDKIHCVLSLQNQNDPSKTIVSVYEQVEPNKYLNIGSGEPSFISMHLKPGSYMLVFENRTMGTLNLCSSSYLELKNGRWAQNLDSVISCKDEQLIKCNQL